MMKRGQRGLERNLVIIQAVGDRPIAKLIVLSLPWRWCLALLGRRGWAARRARAGLLIAAARTATTVATAGRPTFLTFALAVEELEVVRHHTNLAALLARGLVFPGIHLQATFNKHRAAFAQILPRQLSQV